MMPSPEEVVLCATALLVLWNTILSGRRDRVAKTTLRITKATHVLSNSAMGEQKRVNVEFAEAAAVSMHRIAALTGEAGDIAAAEAADIRVRTQRIIYEQHLIRQAKVDAQEQDQENAK
jgi:hypothetical protein